VLDPHFIADDAAQIAIGFASSDELTRKRVKAALKNHAVEIVGDPADDLNEVIDACLDAPVRALVLAMDLGELAPTAQLRLLREELPETPIVVVSMACGPNTVRKAISAGASGYVREAEIEHALPIAIRAACAGQICIPQQARAETNRPAFSLREKQVLELVARGFTNCEIAQKLYLAESTVKSHCSSSFRKLGVRSRKEAAAVVLDPDNGLGLNLSSVSWADEPTLAAG
jgi:DNA-binding NarL/FixJ family response regulator